MYKWKCKSSWNKSTCSSILFQQLKGKSDQPNHGRFVSTLLLHMMQIGPVPMAFWGILNYNCRENSPWPPPLHNHWNIVLDPAYGDQGGTQESEYLIVFHNKRFTCHGKLFGIQTPVGKESGWEISGGQARSPILKALSVIFSSSNLSNPFLPPPHSPSHSTHPRKSEWWLKPCHW